MGPLVIIAGVLVYALLLYFVICICHAAGTMEKFYDQLMDIEQRPRNDESPAQGEALIDGRTIESTGNRDR